MVWAMFLVIYSEQIRGGFTSHMLATYETASECSYEAVKLSSTQRAEEQRHVYMLQRATYQCAAIPKQGNTVPLPSFRTD